MIMTARRFEPLLLVAVLVVTLGGCKRRKDRGAPPKPVLALHFTVDLADCRHERLESVGDEIRRRVVERLRRTGKVDSDVAPDSVLDMHVKGDVLIVTLHDAYRPHVAEVEQAARQAGFRRAPKPVINPIRVIPDLGQVQIRLTPQTIEAVEEEARRAVVRTFRNRLQDSDLEGASVLRRGEEIVVEVPRLSPAGRSWLKRVLPRRARLAFQLVDVESPQMRQAGNLLRGLQERTARKALPSAVVEVFMGQRGPDLAYRPKWRALGKVKVRVDRSARRGREIVEVYLEFPRVHRETVRRFFEVLQTHAALTQYRLPSTREVRFGLVDTVKGQRAGLTRTYVLHRDAPVTGALLEDAQAEFDREARPMVTFRFGKVGEKKFRAFTRQNIKRKLAIVLDGQVMSAPVIQTEIGARGQITLGMVKSRRELLQEAKELAVVLRAGYLGCGTPILARERPLN
jgi:preprotein translocase subunit SecD